MKMVTRRITRSVSHRRLPLNQIPAYDWNMAECSGCGAPTTGNFCADCGAPSRKAQLAPILLDSSGPQIATSRDAVRSGSRGRSLVLGLAILGVVLGGGLLFSQTATDAPETDDAQEVAEQTDTTVSQSSLSQTTQAGAAEASTTTVEEPGELVRSDWFVVVQTNEGIVRVDALTGEKEEVGLDGSLLGEVWGSVLVRRLNGELHTVTLEALGGDLPVETSSETDGSALGSGSRVLQGVRPGFAWIVSDFNGTAWQVDLASGDIVRTSEPDHSSWFEVSPDFRTPVAGGVYALQDDDSYRLVLDGRVLAEAPGRILVNRCDEALNCRNQWIDPVSLEELTQFHTPPGGLDGWFPRSIGNGRFLSINTEAVDSVTGETVRLEGIETEAVWEQRIAVSPDAKFVAMQVRNGKLRIRSVDGSTKISADGVSSGGWDNTPIFVPRTSG